MAVAREDIPARGSKTRLLVGHIRERDLAVNGDAIVIPQHDQPRQLLLARNADGLLADAFHQAAVARDDPGVMVLHLGAPAGAQMLFGHGKAHGIGNPLTQRAGGGFHPRNMAEFRVAGGDRAPLAEILDLVQRHILIPRQVEQRIDQHRAMARRQDETVTVRPARRLGIELQMFLEQDGRHIGHAHRHPRMPRIRGGHRVQRQGADGAGAHPVIGMAGAKRCDVQGRTPVFKGFGRQ